MPSLFSQRPEWLRYVLRLEEPQLPNVLETDRVIPVAEVLQGAWGQQQELRERTVSGPAVSSVDIIDAASDEGYLITHVNAEQVGAARGIFFRVAQPNTGVSVIQRGYALPAGGGADCEALLSNQRHWWVPAGFRFYATLDVPLGAGETLYLKLIFLRVARGLRP